MIQLRLQKFSDVIENTNLLNLPIVFQSEEITDCDQYADHNGFEKRNSKQMLYGFFYYKKPISETTDPECLLPT